MREFDLKADRLQSALTKRFLTPALPALEATFLALRGETDQALAVEACGRYGKPLPLWHVPGDHDRCPVAAERTARQAPIGG